ncbi:hypothetical protein K458DRAFT_384862 [Lentithecium fluviatile CBS 122367]|uniref:Uncharacterized protein n=1 Tax=Lentithecium fluviatile CBS 122367 TaxID=1168545 RepID=A0A6G1JET5_9PLEO|nr:hypothetical protein K458DRAFT_384862 [Lentithecium fluviatile CBS 122367]
MVPFDRSAETEELRHPRDADAPLNTEPSSAHSTTGSYHLYSFFDAIFWNIRRKLHNYLRTFRSLGNTPESRLPSSAPTTNSALSNEDPLMPNVFHRRTRSTSSTSSAAAKPPSIFRYTFILLKARPTVTDLGTISVYFESRSVPASPTLPAYRERGQDYFVVSEGPTERRFGTPPPPYEP